MDDQLIYTATYASPIGSIVLKEQNNQLVAAEFSNEETLISQPATSPLLQNVIHQLEEYFNGHQKTFDLPLLPHGTIFQQKVWNELLQIPFGQTITYLQLAKRLNNIKSIRAAASANGKNPLAIIIPCHRVIGADGKLTGYAGGLHRKKWLLEHEQKIGGISSLF